MEEILPFLGGLAYMAFKIYSNYKKGQEEAKARKISQPFQEAMTKTSPEWIEEEPYYSQPVPESQPSPEKYHEPKYEPVIYKPMLEKRYKEPVYTSAIPHKLELHNPEIPAEEVVVNRAIHKPHKHVFVASQEEEIFYSTFDFKDAIVKEAILNRPQY